MHPIFYLLKGDYICSVPLKKEDYGHLGVYIAFMA